MIYCSPTTSSTVSPSSVSNRCRSSTSTASQITESASGPAGPERPGAEAASAAANMSNLSNQPNSKTVASFFSVLRTVKFEHLIAGVSGGVVSTLILHPLDLLKIRFAVDDGKVDSRPQYSGLRQAFSTIFRQEGLRGLYRGVTPNVAGAGTAWGFYFLFYNTIKTDMQKGNTKKQLSAGMHMLAASEAGILTLAMTNPIWVVKTRLCLQYGRENNASSDPSKRYKGMFDALVKITRHEGIRGLYKGFIPGIWGVSHGAIQFMAYEELKSEYNHYKQQPIDTKLGTGEYLFFAALSKLFAAVTTYPYQVVRARLQDQNCHYKGAYDCVKQTIRDEGYRGFYKGLVPNLSRVVPATAITFVVYEKVSRYLSDLRSDATPPQPPTSNDDRSKDTPQAGGLNDWVKSPAATK